MALPEGSEPRKITEEELQRVALDGSQTHKIGEVGDGISEEVSEDLGIVTDPNKIKAIAEGAIAGSGEIHATASGHSRSTRKKKPTIAEMNAREAELIRKHNRRKMGIYDDED